MQMAFYAIPARGDVALQEELNRFLRSHRVLTVHREFVPQGDNSFWALAAEYIEGSAASGPNIGKSGKPRIDYKDVLSPSDFALFAKLRDWRKTTAGEEGIPVYSVFTNEQLAAIASQRPDCVQQLQKIEGVGDAKTAKYGPHVVQIVNSVSAGSDHKPTPDKAPSPPKDHDEQGG